MIDVWLASLGQQSEESSKNHDEAQKVENILRMGAREAIWLAGVSWQYFSLHNFEGLYRICYNGNYLSVL